MNLIQTLNAIFALPEDDLVREVYVACAHFGHHPSQIEQQLAQVEDPLSSLPSINSWRIGIYW